MKTRKPSRHIYRVIQGVKYIHCTSDPGEFENCKEECRKEGLRYRIINGEEFLKEVKYITIHNSTFVA